MKTILNDVKLDKNQCLMVDDSITDLTAARENGIPFIGVSYGYGADDILDAGVLVNDVSQLHVEIYRSLIFSRIEREVSASQKPAVIGINGVDTSGKSVFTLALNNYLQRRGLSTAIIHTDDFHNPRSMR
jgi:phosphoglycolate phosphatase